MIRGSGENETFKARANFCLKVVAKVEGISDGYLAHVIRAPDNVTRLVPIDISHAHVQFHIIWIR